LAVDNAIAHLRGGVDPAGELVREVRGTIIVMPTGTGKTQTFGAAIKHWPGRVLVLAHRDELIQQARKRLEAMTGELVGLEQAGWTAGRERIVVASVQTLSRGKRLERWPHDAFTLIVIDEAHHAVATTYRKVIDWFPMAKLLGVTATADRADERALEQVFDSVAFKYEVDEAIEDEWLCPVAYKTIKINAIDLSGVKKTAGDLNGAQLKAVFSDERVLHGIAVPVIERCGNRRALAFIDSVDNAHRLAEVMNRYRPGCARAVDGGTNLDDRRALFRGHQRGDYQFLVNVGVATEGYDDPAISAIIMARPTLSRALYAQMIGRGLRIFPGKDLCVVYDCVGNTGRHSLVTALDVLGGTWDEEVKKRVLEESEKDGEERDVRAAVGQAKRDLAAEKARVEREKREAEARSAVKAKVDYSVNDVDPFLVMGMKHGQMEDFDPRPASVGQVAKLKKFGFDVPEGLTMSAASKLLGNAIVRIKKGLASYKQIKTLGRHGIDAKRMRLATASKLMDALIANGWRDLSPKEVARIVNSREMGED